MCGRITQYRYPIEYLEALGQMTIDGVDPTPIGRYNVPPQSRVQLLHRDQDGLRMDGVRWGYAPFWAQGKRPPAINAKVETAATSRFFRDIWAMGRTLVAADGWYEWVKDPAAPKKKQPYYIRRKDGEPLWFAALAQLDRTGLTERDGDGFVILTAISDQGMVDIHDRRPVVLEADLAREWIEPDLPFKRAEEIVRDLALKIEAFEWFEVNRAIGNVRNEGPSLIEPIKHSKSNLTF